MNGLTATGVTVGICAGLWQLVSSHVGLSQGWELLGTILHMLQFLCRRRR